MEVGRLSPTTVLNRQDAGTRGPRGLLWGQERRPPPDAAELGEGAPRWEAGRVG